MDLDQGWVRFGLGEGWVSCHPLAFTDPKILLIKYLRTVRDQSEFKLGGGVEEK